MKYYAALLRMLDAEKSQSLRPQHLEHIANALRQGRIAAYGPFTDGAGGLIVYKAESIEEATQLAQFDPYVVEGARRLEIHEWQMKLEK